MLGVCLGERLVSRCAVAGCCLELYLGQAMFVFHLKVSRLLRKPPLSASNNVSQMASCPTLTLKYWLFFFFFTFEHFVSAYMRYIKEWCEGSVENSTQSELSAGISVYFHISNDQRLR